MLTLQHVFQRKKSSEKVLQKENDICCLCGDNKHFSKFTDIFSSVGRQKGIAEN
jgi:hypothetical protein